jgi:hypothetical protein
MEATPILCQNQQCGN